MGKEISRIRLNRLYSESNIFEEISFHDGVNIILGEKYDDSSVKGRKTNGVGKSMSIEFLDFGFLNDYEKSRIAKIPKEVFPLEENVILDLDIGDEAITIKRNRKQADQPVIIREGRTVSFDKLQDAREYLTGLIFPKLNGKKVPSFRNLFSILMRDERSEFTDIIKCHDLTKKIPDDLSAHLFLLGFSLEAYKNTLETIKEIEAVNTVIAKDKKELTQEGKKKISDVKAELNALEDELQKWKMRLKVLKRMRLLILWRQTLLNWRICWISCVNAKRLCDMTMKKSEKCQSRSRLMTEKSNWSITNLRASWEMQ